MDITPVEPRVISVKQSSEAKGVHQQLEKSQAEPAQSLSEVTELVKKVNAEASVATTRVREQELELNKALRQFGATELKVELRDAGEGPVFHIVDKETGKELLQIPSEYKLSIERTVEMLRGALFDKRV